MAFIIVKNNTIITYNGDASPFTDRFSILFVLFFFFCT